MNGLSKGMLWYNLRLLPKISLIVSAASIVIIQIFFSLKMVDFRVMANIGEIFVSLLGIILIPGLAFIEDNSGLRETVYSKAVTPVIPAAIRLVYTVIVLLLGVATFAGIAVLQESVFDELSIIIGVFISAFIMGAAGYIMGSFTGNIALSYLVPFAYYCFEFLSKGRYTKDFYLFSLQRGYLAEEKWVLLAIGVLFIAVSLLYTGNSTRRSIFVHN
ncbi:MAG TPA: hypothetical protein VIO64_09300 [Pseudobacteroides sp.]|uniref:hypothetical protein n=1 Tax=Pseudobacteroides sp. TaxID=1968840 RepID=UPI002F93690B